MDDMDDMDGMDRDEWIARLSAEGWSVRRIAAEVQVSKSRLQQILAALNAADEWAEDDGLALLDAEEPEYQAVPPSRFVGIGERGEERFLDGNGESVSVLDIWRAEDTEDGGSVGCGYLADAMAQVEADGYVGVSDGEFWHWELAVTG